MWGFETLVMLVMIVMNGFFAAYEIALASITRTRLLALVQQSRRGASAALNMKNSIEGSLAVVQLGITLVGAIAAATAGAGAEEQIAPRLEAFGLSDATAEVLGIILVVLPLTAITIIFGELIPKVFALRNQEWVCLKMSPVMQWFAYAVWPVVWVLETTVTLLIQWGETFWGARLAKERSGESQALQELRASVAVARTARLIGIQEERIILGAAQLSKRRVREIMLPAQFISMLDINSSIIDALVAAHSDMHTRFPVTERPGDPQAIVGYCIFKDIVAQMRFSPDEPSLRPIVRKIASFPEDMSVATCLQQLIREYSHIALVRDAAGKVVGMVTMEDIIEELVGDIEDEYDKLPAHLVTTGRGWIVGGGLTLEVLRNQTGIDLTADGTDAAVRTVSDWIAQKLNRPIRGAETIEGSAARVLVRKSRRNKVMEAYIVPLPRS